MHLGLPLFVVPIVILVRKVRKGSHRSATQLGSTFQVLTQMFQGVRTVKAYRTEDRELARFAETNRSYLNATMKMIARRRCRARGRSSSPTQASRSWSSSWDTS